MRIPDRLKKIAEFIDKDSVVLDIGCDHAYLSIYLIESSLSIKCYAVDNKKGPLLNAKLNVKKAGLENKVFLYLSDGVEGFNETDYTHIVMSGLGGELISSILENPKINKDATLVLSPHNNAYELRKTLSSLSYEIVDEDIIYSNKKYYPIIKAKKSSDLASYSYEELFFGPILLKNKPELFIDSINRELEILSRYDKSNREVKAKIDLYRSAL